MRKFLIPLLLCVAVKACGQPTMPPKREFRALWVATIHNIDWPSVRGLSPDSQRSEFRALLDTAQKAGFNAIIVQIRPSGDAFYPSQLAPWSEWLTGTQGKAPDPYYDPMAFMVEEAHARGLEFHAWLNPFRAVSHMGFRSVDSSHMARRRPDWMLVCGEQRFFNPGIPEVRSYLTQVVMEVAANYPVDGIHFDDYFYPYTEPGISYDDRAIFAQYGSGGDIRAWRRSNIDAFIQEVSDSLRKNYPRVKFGVSPTGVWRNRDHDPLGSDSQGYSSYDDSYADVRKWLENHWIDYVAPQLYWGISHPSVGYAKLLPWWSQNHFGRHLYVGQALFRLEEKDSPTWKNPEQLLEQLTLNRSFPEVKGSIFYSASALMQNPYGMCERLRRERYPYPALPPVMAWKDSVPPQPPRQLVLTPDSSGITLRWSSPKVAADGEMASEFAVYLFDNQASVKIEDPRFLVGRVREMEIHIPKERLKGPCTFVVSSLDRLHNESRTCAVAFWK